jgi:hypothetical protein
VIADEADDAAPGALGDAALGNSEEADVKIVEIELSDAPVSLESFLVGHDKAGFLGGRRAGEGVVRRIAEDHQDWLCTLDLGCFIALVGERRVAVAQPSLLGVGRGGFLRGGPPGEGVGKIDGRALMGEQGHAGFAQEVTDLPMSDDVWRGHDFEAGDAGHRSLFEVFADERVLAIRFRSSTSTR